MKKIYPYLLSLITITTIDAQTIPNYNSTTGVISFPVVTVDNKTTFTEVELLLDNNGQWKVLSAKQEETVNLTGYWKGASGFVEQTEKYEFQIFIENNIIFIPEAITIPLSVGSFPSYYELALIQTGKQLTGRFCHMISGVNCLVDGVPTGNVIGSIQGSIEHENISFTLTPDSNIFSEESFVSGFLSEDESILAKENKDIISEQFKTIYSWAFIKE